MSDPAIDIQVVTPPPAHGAEVLTPGALAFVAGLHRTLNPRRLELLAARSARQAEFDAGALPDFLPETAAIRNDPEWRDVRLGLGSVAATPIRESDTEAALEGSTPDEKTADHAASILASELQPIDDVRSTADYRRAVAARVLHRLIRDEGGW